MSIHFTPYDLVLIAAVTVMSTAVAYLHAPRWKALVLSLPVPFTLLTLSLAHSEGRLVDATNVIGMLYLLLYTHGVRWLHLGLGLPIVPSIVLAAGGYCAAATVTAPLIPTTEAAFWTSAALALAVAVGLVLGTRPRSEPGHRSPLPIWIKAPLIAGVIVFLVLIRKLLLGFVAMFPMVGLITAYEARHSLWTISRQIPIFMVPMTGLMIAVRLTQTSLGIGWALAIGWAVFLALFAPITFFQHAGAENGADRSP